MGSGELRLRGIAAPILPFALDRFWQLKITDSVASIQE